MALKPVELLRKIDALLQLEQRHGEAIRRLSEEVAALKERVGRLEGREEVLLVRAEAAASTAAAVAATATIADIARRIGALEERSQRPMLPGNRE